MERLEVRQILKHLFQEGEKALSIVCLGKGRQGLSSFSKFLLVAVIKYSGQKQHREGKGLVFCLHFQVTDHIIVGSQGRNSSRNLKQKPWKNTDCWLLSRFILSFLILPRTICPGNDATHSGSYIY